MIAFAHTKGGGTFLNTNLRDKTLELLKNRHRDITFEYIASNTPLKVQWLKAFSSGEIQDPSSSKVETLYTFLTGKPLQL